MTARKGKLISSDEGHTANKQHTTPCSDCPYRRDSMPGWLGGYPAEDFARFGHQDVLHNCHVITNQQCAGLAIFRRNVVKRVDPPLLSLPADKELVFSWDNEFLAHHNRENKK